MPRRSPPRGMVTATLYTQGSNVFNDQPQEYGPHVRLATSRMRHEQACSLLIACLRVRTYNSTIIPAHFRVLYRDHYCPCSDIMLLYKHIYSACRYTAVVRRSIHGAVEIWRCVFIIVNQFHNRSPGTSPGWKISYMAVAVALLRDNPQTLVRWEGQGILRLFSSQ